MTEILKVLYYFENIEFQENLETTRITTFIKTQGNLYPREVFILVLTYSSVNIFGEHTGEWTENLKSGLAFLKDT